MATAAGGTHPTGMHSCSNMGRVERGVDPLAKVRVIVYSYVLSGELDRFHVISF